MRIADSFLRTLSLTAILVASSSLALAAGNPAPEANADSADARDGSIVNAGATVTNDSPIQLAYSAAGVLRAQSAAPADAQIPESLLAGAHCIGVFPTVFKEGLLAAAKHGDGIVSCRNDSGEWGDAAPVFFGLSGGSFGLQAGARVTQVVMLFMDNDAVNNLADGRFKIGADAAVTAGPTGANASIHSAPAGVVVYRLGNSGGFIGAQVKGSWLGPDDDINSRLYGSNVDIKQLLTGQHEAPEELQVFSKALADYAPASEYNADKGGSDHG